MSNMVNFGDLRGRSFGDVAALTNVNLRSVCTTIASSERYCVMKIASMHSGKLLTISFLIVVYSDVI